MVEVSANSCRAQECAGRPQLRYLSQHSNAPKIISGDCSEEARDASTWEDVPDVPEPAKKGPAKRYMNSVSSSGAVSGIEADQRLQDNMMVVW